MEDSYQSAKYYDAYLHLFVWRIRKKILEIAQRNKYQNILDVCCGTGNQLKLFSKHGVNGIGIDLSQTMLNVAKSGKIKAECYEQDAENIDFSDKSFDMVTTTFALHEKSVESAKLILKEMIRLTKINGDIIIVDFSIDEKTAYLSKKGIIFIESMAGEEHYDNFKDYNKVGGLDYLLDGLPLKEIEHHDFALNGVALKVLRKI